MLGACVRNKKAAAPFEATASHDAHTEIISSQASQL